MPIYEYECLDCSKQHELIVRHNDNPLTVCPACGGQMKKLISKSTFVLKGTGWYVTDYAAKDKDSTGKIEKDGDTKSEKSAETKTEPKTETKVENKNAAKTEAKTESKSESKTETKPEPKAEPAGKA